APPGNEPGTVAPGGVAPGVSLTNPSVPVGPPVMIANEAPRPADPLAPIVAPDPAMCADRTLSDPRYSPGYTPDPAVQAQAQTWISQMSIEQKVNQLIGIPDPGARDGSVYEDIQRSQDDLALGIKGW